ncbi:MAG: CaiB/BaiF CoA transferase family protein [bacterium]
MSLPLSGVRILDFGHVVTGPFATSLLADLGADVVKVESGMAPDQARRLGPFRPGGPQDLEGSAIFASLNRNKRSVAINLKHPEGIEIALALAERSDVLTENFSVGVMERLGLGPDRVLERNRRLIYVSMSGLGAHGPHADWVSFNIIIQALSGLMLTTGSPGDPPVAVSNSWADFVAGLHGALVVAAALCRREVHGQGCWIDLSQYEANVLPLGHLVMASQRAGRAVGRAGNRSMTRAPQGCYRCDGEDAWCVLSVGDAAEWRSLVGLLGDDVLSDPRFDSLQARLAHAEEIDRSIEAWTRRRPARQAEETLQRAGIPATAVRTTGEVLDDLPRFSPGRRSVHHPVIGEMPVFPAPIRFDAAGARVDRAGPRLGEHTREVLHDLLGMSDAELARLHDEGVLA